MATHLIDLPQGGESWKLWRRNKIGASEIATVMNLNPYESALELWNRKISGAEIEENEAMREGKRKEPLARAAAFKQLGYWFAPVCFENDELPWLVLSLDGYNEISPVHGIEIKAPGAKNHATAKLGVVCPHWFPQLQAQMAGMGWDEMFFMSYMSDDDFEIFKVKRDDSFIEKMKTECDAFHRCLIEMIPPEPTDRDLVEIVDPEARKAAGSYWLCCLEIERLEKEKDCHRQELLEFCKGKSSRIGDLKMKKIVRKGAVDYQKIPAVSNMLPEALEAFRKPKIESWRFS